DEGCSHDAAPEQWYAEQNLEEQPQANRIGNRDHIKKIKDGGDRNRAFPEHPPCQFREGDGLMRSDPGDEEHGENNIGDIPKHALSYEIINSVIEGDFGNTKYAAVPGGDE